MVEIRSGDRPSRPDFKINEQEDCSLAIAVIGDESGSMRGSRQVAAATAMYALADCFDSLGAPVLCAVAMNGRYDSDPDTMEYQGDVEYHRSHSIQYRLFKDWGESLRQTWKRFGSYTATGGTPLCDGIQYGLRALSERPERFRIMVVLTDGEPANSAVVERQIRLAREAGITVIGVGIGAGCEPVATLFPTSVVVENLEVLPKSMIKAVTEVVFPKKARRMNLDGGRGGGRGGVRQIAGRV
jgi:hypothetical protein